MMGLSKKKRFYPLGLVLSLIVVLSTSVLVDSACAARQKKYSRYNTEDRYASIVVEASSGLVLSQKNADKQLYPASLTKMMTLYLTFEALENGTLSKNERIVISRHATRQEPSKLGIEAGSTIRVEDAVLGLVTKSANDAAVALAEAIGGSEQQFARMMTQKAKRLGMNNTQFVNASGLHNKQQYSTARDMATLSRALMRDFPQHYSYFGTQTFTYAGYEHKNHNKLMNSYTGMDGLKTGYVSASGFNLAASAVRDGHRLIGVVFGGKTSKSRNKEMARLLDGGFERMQDDRIAYMIRKNRSVASLSPRAKALMVASTVPSITTVALSKVAPAAGVPDEEEENAQGDADDGSDTVVAAVQEEQKPEGAWAVQIGSFANKKAGLTALNRVQKRLTEKNIADSGQSVVVPLKTNRGFIYRARLAGLDRSEADEACRLLKGSCLVLAMR